METKRKIEIVGISVALLIIARHFVSKYQDTLKYWKYLCMREEKFRALYISYQAKSLFARGEKKKKLQKQAEMYRRKAAWYLDKLGTINKQQQYEK